MIEVRRIVLVLGGLAMMCVGIILGAALTKGDCESSTKDGGLTIQETCVRDVSP